MRYKTQQWLCVMISMMICLALMGALNYLFARVRMFEQLPFSWGNKDAVGFERLPGSPDIHFRDIIDIDTDREVTIISVDREQRAMGLYDPALFFRHEKGLYGVAEEERYFSDQDYRTGADVSIFVSHQDFASPEERGQVAGNKNSRGGKVLFAIEPRYGRLYVPWVDEVRNLASVSKLGSEVYVRSESQTVLADIRERLSAVGYTEKRLMIPPFISGLRQAIMAGRVKEHLLPATVLCLYLGFAVAMYYHHRRYRKQMKVAQIFGAGLFSMSRYRVWPFVVKVCLLLVLFGAMMHLWEGKWFISGLPEIYRVWILVLHGVVSVLLYQIGFVLQYLRLRLSTGGAYEV